MQIFVTGASGYIGQVVVEHAIAQGHAVTGLARSKEAFQKVESVGAKPVLGALGNIGEIEHLVRAADAVLHLAFDHNWDLPVAERLATDRAAVEGMVRALAGSGKPLIVTTGAAVVEPDPAGGETDEFAPASDTFVLKDRIRNERAALALANEGVRVAAIRLPPYVHGRGGSSFLPLLMQAAAKLNVSLYIDGGTKRTSAVHVDDVARCFLLAIERAAAGAAYNCTSETGVTTRQLAEAIGEAMNVPVRGTSRAEAEQFWGPFVAGFVDVENRASSARARRELGWEPQAKLGILEDITRGSYRDVAPALRAQAAAAKG